MRVSGVLGVVLAWAFAGIASAQGFAGLGAEAGGYDAVRPDTQLSFPADHGPHPGFRIEWWYVTANLTDKSGAPLGVQWTVFRIATRAGGPDEGWGSRQLWMGHAAVTDADRHLFAERFARGGIGQAGARVGPVEVWVDDWRLAGEAMEAVRMTAAGDGFAYDLGLEAEGPLVLNGVAGYSVKSEAGQASHYYSQPHYRVMGTVTLDGVAREVTGAAWLDREWSSQPLTEDQTGWDWFSLRFETGEKLMIYGLRDADGGRYVTGTWIDADGTAEEIPPGQTAMTPLEEGLRGTPVRWRLEMPARGLDIEVMALNPASFMDTTFPYWEGPVAVSGSHQGVGYLEMTGN